MTHQLLAVTQALVDPVYAAWHLTSQAAGQVCATKDISGAPAATPKHGLK